MDSILTSVKKMLGITEEYEYFDADIIMHINSVFMILQQLGVGPQEGYYSIKGKENKWSEFLPSGEQLELAKSYMYLKVKLMFDISTLTSPLIEAINRQIQEFEWRLNVQVDPIPMSEVDNPDSGSGDNVEFATDEEDDEIVKSILGT